VEFEVRTVGRADIAKLTIVKRDLRGTRYSGTSNVHFKRARIVDIDFRGIGFDQFSAEAATFERCQFSSTTFEDGTFSVKPQSVYRDCDFTGSSLGFMDPGQARFERCTFDRVKLNDWESDAAEFLECGFSGHIKDSRFSGRPWGMWKEPGYLDPPRTRNDFRGNDFRGAEIVGCDFIYGIPISEQLWPEGDDYIRLDNLPERVARARRIVDAWPDEAERKEALILLDVYSEAGYAEQGELFANRWDLDVPRAVAAKFWTLLESLPVGSALGPSSS
jgi:hypothetical protein